MFDLKKYKRVIFHDTEGWCKIWRKPVLWFGKWNEEYGKYSPEHLKVSKLGLWWDPLIQNRKRMSLKSTEELCVMTMKNDAKFEEELTCHFKIDMRNLNEFWSKHLKVSTNFILMCSFWAKYICLSKKRTEELSFMNLKRDTKFGEESTCRFKIDVRNLTNSDLSTWKSQKFSL